MNSQNQKPDETLTNTSDAKDILNLETDNEDVGNEEVSELSDEREEVDVKEVKGTSEATQPSREPRPLFLGRPNNKPRGNRGSRKNKKKPETTNEGLKVSKPNDPNQMQTEEIPNSNGINAGSKASQLAKPNETQSNESTEPPRSNETNPNVESGPTQEGHKTKHKPVTIEALIEKYGSPHNRISYAGQPWNNGSILRKIGKGPRKSKRPLSKNNSPENIPKRHKTYASVLTDDLVLYIADRSGDIDETKAGELEKRLMEKFLEFLSTKPKTAPTYHSSSVRYGNLKLICTDKFLAEWFTRVVEEMSPPWEGANLEITTDETRKNNPREPRPKQPRRPSVRFFIPDGMLKPDFKTVVNILKAQNPPLNTDDWTTWKQEEQDYGTFYHVSVKDEDVDFINGKEGRLFFCFQKIKIITPKQPKGEAMVGNDVEMSEKN